jgi:ketosteroid isomerase-like protein
VPPEVALHPHAAVLHAFYGAFQRRDYRAMAACYTPDAEFHDSVFTHLSGWRVGAMWRMLCERAVDLRVAVDDIRASDTAGSAHWEAWYTFSQTGRSVHNRVDASFLFQDGKIRRHTDVFDLYAWTRQALGPMGLLLGWTPQLQRAIRARSSRALDAFSEKHGLATNPG